MKVPKGGFTLEDICKLADFHKVYINIGVAKPNVGRNPTRITVQVHNLLPDSQPKAFEMDLMKAHPRLNDELSRALLRYCQDVAPKKLIVL